MKRSRFDLKSFFDYKRGEESLKDFGVKLALIRRVLDFQNEVIWATDDDFSEVMEPGIEELYALLNDVLDGIEMVDPFSSYEEFEELLKTLQTERNFTWEAIVDYCNPEDKFRVRESLFREMSKVIAPGFQKVLIPEAEKFSYYLVEIINSKPDANFTLMSTDPFYLQILSVMFSLNDRVDIIESSIYDYDNTSGYYSAIISVPRFGTRDLAEENSNFICRELDLIAFENLSLWLQSGGSMAIALPARVTFGSGNVKSLRDFIQSMYCIEEISSLPPNVFPSISVKSNLIVVKTGRTEEVTIKKYKFSSEDVNTSDLVVEDETFVYSDELSEMGDWNVDRIFASQDEDWLRFQQSNIRKQELGVVASVFRGKAITKKDENGRIGVVNISNIGDYDIDYSTLDHVDEEERRVANYILCDGDLLLPARGTTIRIAVFEEQPYTCIASSNIIVVRPKDDTVSSTYLKIFFDSPIGRKILESRQQGTSVFNISYKELANIEIPLLSVDEQKEMTDEYNKELQLYKKTIKEAEKRWKKTIKHLQERI